MKNQAQILKHIDAISELLQDAATVPVTNVADYERILDAAKSLGGLQAAVIVAGIMNAPVKE